MERLALPRNLRKNSKLNLLLALLLSGSMWFYVQHVEIGHQLAEAARYGIPRGNLSDLYARWLGARELLLHHRDPYSSEVTREIQMGYYGRPLDRSRPYDPMDEQRFAYPVYVVFLLAPTIRLPFSVVQPAFKWFLIAITTATILLWLRILRWRPSAWIVATIVVLVLGSFQVIQGIKVQQLSLLVNGFLTGSALLLAEGQLAWAGVLLALATIKPQLAVLLSAWLLLWAVSDWRARQPFVWGFAVTLGTLAAAGELVLPGWIGRFRQAIIAYRQYNYGAESAVELLLTPVWGRVVTVAVVLGLAVVCWRMRRVSNSEPAFSWIFALILAAIVAVVPKQAPYNQVLLVAPVLLIVRAAPRMWARSFASRLALWITALIVFWPWLAALGIMVSSPFLSAADLERAYTLPLYTVVFIPLIVFVVVGFAFDEVNKKGTKAGSTQVST